MCNNYAPLDDLCHKFSTIYNDREFVGTPFQNATLTHIERHRVDVLCEDGGVRVALNCEGLTTHTHGMV